MEFIIVHFSRFQANLRFRLSYPVSIILDSESSGPVFDSQFGRRIFTPSLPLFLLSRGILFVTFWLAGVTLMIGRLELAISYTFHLGQWRDQNTKGVHNYVGLSTARFYKEPSGYNFLEKSMMCKEFSFFCQFICLSACRSFCVSAFWLSVHLHVCLLAQLSAFWLLKINGPRRGNQNYWPKSFLPETLFVAFVFCRDNLIRKVFVGGCFL